jgi:hypothetical protein
MFSTLARGYNSLQQSAAPQSAASTIDKLCDRLLNQESLEERKAALLGLKGLSRDWKSVSLAFISSNESFQAKSRVNKQLDLSWRCGVLLGLLTLQ